MFRNIVFAGTPDIARNLLKDLIINRYNISSVYTQPDRPKGRKLQVELSPVKQEAIAHNIPVMQPTTLKDPMVIKHLQQLNPDLIIVFAYGLIFPKEILNIPKFGCFNVHTSLLPKYRGAAPIQHAILNGDKLTGISIIKMDSGLDTGDIWHSVTCEISEKDTTESLAAKLQPLSTIAILYVLEHFNNIKPLAQDHTLATYANKINKYDAKVDWTLPAYKIERKIRALIPTPIAFTEIKNPLINENNNSNNKLNNKYLYIRIWQAKMILNIENTLQSSIDNEFSNQPGKILNINKNGIEVLTGKGNLILEKLQFPGSKVLKIAELINSFKYKNLLEKTGFFS